MLPTIIYELNNLYFVLASDGESNIYTHINKYIYTHKYTHKHTHTHTHTHTYSLFSRTSLPLQEGIQNMAYTFSQDACF